MPQFSVIKDRVEEYLIDVPTATSLLIDAWVNKAVRDAQDEHNILFMDKTHSFTTALGTRVLGTKAAIGDWKERRALPWLHLGDGDNKEIKWAPSKSEMIRRFTEDDAEDKGQPQFILETETNFEVYPLPDDESLWDDGNHRVKLPYWSYLPALVQDEATNWFTDNADWYLVFQASAHGLLFNRDPQNASTLFQMATQELSRVVRLDKRKKLTHRSHLSISFNAR